MKTKSYPIILITFAAMLAAALVGWGVCALLAPTSSQASDAAFSLKMWGVIVGALVGLIAAAVYFWFRARGRKETAYQSI